MLGGIVSVVLSLSLRTVAVNDYHALCCPDFPLLKKRLPFRLEVDYIIFLVFYQWRSWLQNQRLRFDYAEHEQMRLLQIRLV